MYNQCKSLQPELVTMRRALHQIPEVGKFLPKTAAYVVNELERLEIPYTLSKEDSSIIAEIKGAEGGKTIALRADMDALPIQEANDVDYKSTHDECMHACGHDTHITMLLGAAKVLKANQNSLKGNVRLLFQTAEELAKGAQIMIKNGCLEGVDAIFGMHIGSILDPSIPTGTVVATTGTCMASYDRFILKIKGNACHGSTPEKGVDPINIASHIVIALQEVIARELSATQAGVLTMGQIHGGNQYNIIPETVEIEGTIRSFENDVRLMLAKRIEEISTSVATTFRGVCEYEMDWGAPPVVNHEDMVLLAQKAASKVVGEDMVMKSRPAPNMAGEDFAYYLTKVPGAFLFLSSSDAEKATNIAHHNPHFNVDEDVLYKGSALFVSIVEEYFGQ